VEEEAARQALEVERARGRTSELLTPSYERAVEWLEEAQRTDLRAQDVLAMICA
jgi:N12 class adenine-specific DNA methylase